MTIKFDENGHATEAGEVVVYNFRDITHELVGESVEQIPIGFGIPGHSTLEVPLNTKEGFAICFNGGWVYVEDNRGLIEYNTKTKEEFNITYLGPVSDGFTLLVPGKFDLWDGEKWVTDVSAEDGSTRQHNTLVKEMLLNEASNSIDVLTDATDPDVMGDDILPEDVELLKQWKAYRVKLSRITDMLNPVWPALPE